MPRYRYTAFSGDGHKEVNVLEAVSEIAAVRRLAELGLTVVSISLVDGVDGPKAAWFTFDRRPSLTAQADLADQLEILFSANLPAPRVAEVVQQTSGQAAIRRHFHRVSQLMEDGARFAPAMRQASDRLSPLFATLADLGETAGRPGAQMGELADALRRQSKMTAKVLGALLYPAILMVGATAVLVIMSLFLAPRLETIFTSVNRPVPTSIALFITAGHILTQWGVVILCAFLAMTIVGFRAARKQAHKLPLVGAVLRDAVLTRMIRSLHLMLLAGVPLSSALRQSADAYQGSVIADLFRDAAGFLEGGQPASLAFADTPHVPPLFRELFALGERTNTLTHILGTTSTALENDVERRLHRMTSLLTPLLTLGVGGVISGVVLSVMEAILSVNDLAF